MRSADGIEQREDLDLRFHLLGDGFNDDIRLTRRLFDGAGVFEAFVRGVGSLLAYLAEFNGFVEIAANLSLCAAQAGGNDVLDDGAITAERCGMSNATPHNAGAD